MYMNMPSDNISYIAMYVIAVYIIVQYILINGDIDTVISVYTAIAANICICSYMEISKQENFIFCFSLKIPLNLRVN